VRKMPLLPHPKWIEGRNQRSPPYVVPRCSPRKHCHSEPTAGRCVRCSAGSLVEKGRLEGVAGRQEAGRQTGRRQERHAANAGAVARG